MSQEDIQLIEETLGIDLSNIVEDCEMFYDHDLTDTNMEHL